MRSSPANESLKLRASAALELYRRESAAVDFYDFVPRVDDRYAAPSHLDPLVRLLRRSWSERMRVTAHAPPRHGKTETVLEFIAQTMARFPDRHFAYATYAQAIANEKSTRCKELALAAGVQLARGQNRADRWVTEQGGSFRAVGIGGPLTGVGAHFLFVDDPYKDRPDAESAAYQRRVMSWWDDVGGRRLQPGGSAFIFHTRWTTADLIGKLHEREGLVEDGGRWHSVIMPAIDDEGRALWPEGGWTVEALQEAQANPYTWASLFQGRPQPRGGALFGPAQYYDTLPNIGIDAFGADLAYTAKTKSDYSVVILGRLFDGRIYIVDVLRVQLRSDALLPCLLAFRSAAPLAPGRMYGAGTEQGPIDLMNAQGAGITFHAATADKFVRALPASTAWNLGRILLPRGLVTGPDGRPYSPPWVADFVREVTSFTGVADAHDDQVDALAALHDELASLSYDTEVF